MEEERKPGPGVIAVPVHRMPGNVCVHELQGVGDGLSAAFGQRTLQNGFLAVVVLVRGREVWTCPVDLPRTLTALTDGQGPLGDPVSLQLSRSRGHGLPLWRAAGDVLAEERPETVLVDEEGVADGEPACGEPLYGLVDLPRPRLGPKGGVDDEQHGGRPGPPGDVGDPDGLAATPSVRSIRIVQRTMRSSNSSATSDSAGWSRATPGCRPRAEQGW